MQSGLASYVQISLDKAYWFTIECKFTKQIKISFYKSVKLSDYLRIRFFESSLANRMEKVCDVCQFYLFVTISIFMLIYICKTRSNGICESNKSV